MKKKQIALSVHKVNKQYVLRGSRRHEQFLALSDLNLKIYQGERVALLGDNGAGKTTLLKLMTGIAEPSSGKIQRFGKVVSLIDITAGFHQEFSGRENIALNAVLLGLNLQKIKAIEESVIAFSGIAKFIDQPLYTYSSGMVLRLGFAIAIHADPEILILDEGIIVGDQNFQKKAYDKVEEIFAQGKTIVVCSHMLPLLKRLCDRFIWLDQGRLMMDGGPEVLIEYKKNRDTLQLEETPGNDKADLLFDFLKTLPIGEKFIARAASGSMEPLILKGDEIEVKRVAFKSLKKGDVIAFWSEELRNVVVHRFYKLERGKIVTKGDNSLIADSGYVLKKNFLGVLAGL